jgi:hypothetical protein
MACVYVARWLARRGLEMPRASMLRQAYFYLLQQDYFITVTVYSGLSSYSKLALGVNMELNNRIFMPIWGKFRFAEKLVGPLTLLLSILAAFGAERLSSRFKDLSNYTGIIRCSSGYPW